MIQSNQVRSAIGALGLRHQDVADAIGVCRQTIARFVHGGNISLKTATKMEHFFRDHGVSFSDVDGKAVITIDGESRYALDKAYPSAFDLLESRVKSS